MSKTPKGYVKGFPMFGISDESSSTEFKIHDKVKVTELKANGIIVSILGMKYEVRYFWDGKVENMYFYDFELEKISV